MSTTHSQQSVAAKIHDPSSEIYGRVTRRIVPLLFLGYMFAFIDRFNIGYAALQMNAHLGFSAAVYGLGASIFFLGYVILEVPSNVLLQKIGARLTIMRIMVLWGLTSAGMMFVRTPMEFYVARFLLGVFEAGFFPGIVLYLTFWYPVERRGRIVAIIMSATVVGAIVTAPLSGWILQQLDGYRDLRGWQWMLLIEGLPSALFGVVIYFMLPNGPGDAKWLTSSEKLQIQSDLRPGARATEPVHSIREQIAALKHPAVYLFSFIYFSLNCGAQVFSFWLPAMIKDLGVSDPKSIGMYALIPYVVGAVTMIWYGRRSDNTGERRWHLGIAAIAAGVGLLLLPAVKLGLWPSIAFITVALSGVVATLPVFWAAATGQLSARAAAAGIAAITSIGNLSGLFVPYMLGVVKNSTGTVDIGLYAVSGMMICGAIVMVASRTIRRNAVV